ncbi:hypothetical protein FOA52_006443 [Chlamydomonas sp. UWO 241]|nr:hypothetical protein FOA52_006443 [Chlamydomonas sp. UWO 241]
MVHVVVVSVDESPSARQALDFCLTHVMPRHPTSAQLHILTVLPPIHAVVPVGPAPFASAAAMSTTRHQWDAEYEANQQRAHELLRKLGDIAVAEFHIPADAVHMHVVPAIGGASGLGESLVEASKKLKADLLVLGTRGMGAMKSSLMSFVGCGSVSDYCIHQAKCPVLVVHPAKDIVEGSEASPLGTTPSQKKVLVCTDDSPSSKRAMQWYLDRLVMPSDHVHLVSVALIPMPTVLLDEPSVVAMEKRMNDEEGHAIEVETAAMVERAVEKAQAHGVLRSHLTSAVLQPKPGAVSDVGVALCSYARDKDIDIMVVGSRGLGAWQRSLMGALGLGSVSDYLAHHLQRALLVVRDGPQSAESSHEDTGMLLPRVEEAAAEDEGVGAGEGGKAGEPEGGEGGAEKEKDKAE